MAGEKPKAPLFGKKSEVETEVNEIEVKAPEAVSTPMITLTIDELKAMVAAEVAVATKTTQAPVQKTFEKEERTIKNLLTDDIPELRDFKAKERIYVLVDGSKPEAREIKSRHKQGSPLQYHNKETNEVHALFYSMTQASFFKDRHLGDSKVDHIFMKEGMLKTYESDVKLQKFLAIHPDNIAMGGGLFKEYNPNEEAETSLDDIDVKFEAEKLAREISFLKQDAVARLLCKNYKETWSPAEMKLSLFQEAGKQPKEFMKLANDPRLEVKGIAKTAAQRGFIEYRNYKFYNDQGEIFCEVARNQNEWEAIADYFLSGLGKGTYEYLRNAID